MFALLECNNDFTFVATAADVNIADLLTSLFSGTSLNPYLGWSWRISVPGKERH